MSGLDDVSELTEAISSASSQTIIWDNFIEEKWIPSLNSNMRAVRFTLHADCDFVKKCQTYLERWNLPREYLKNHVKRLEGSLCFPALILRNPPEIENLPFEMLVANASTFQWLISVLKPHGLDIKDIRTINILPFITEGWLKSLEPADQVKALQESLDLTAYFFRAYPIGTVISCQCLAKQAPEWLEPIIHNTLVQSLSSNVLNAMNRTIKVVQLYGYTINVIQGFHPSYILQARNEKWRNDRHHILSSLLLDTYTPCQLWRKREIIASMGNMLPQLQDSASNLRRLISNYKNLEKELYTVSCNTDYYVYTRDGRNGGKETPFQIQLWHKVLSYFLFFLPRQAMTLGLRDNRDSRPSDVVSPGAITPEIKAFLRNLLEGASSVKT